VCGCRGAAEAHTAEPSTDEIAAAAWKYVSAFLLSVVLLQPAGDFTNYLCPEPLSDTDTCWPRYLTKFTVDRYRFLGADLGTLSPPFQAVSHKNHGNRGGTFSTDDDTEVSKNISPAISATPPPAHMRPPAPIPRLQRLRRRCAPANPRSGSVIAGRHRHQRGGECARRAPPPRNRGHRDR